MRSCEVPDAPALDRSSSCQGSEKDRRRTVGWRHLQWLALARWDDPERSLLWPRPRIRLGPTLEEYFRGVQVPVDDFSGVHLLHARPPTTVGGAEHTRSHRGGAAAISRSAHSHPGWRRTLNASAVPAARAHFSPGLLRKCAVKPIVKSMWSQWAEEENSGHAVRAIGFRRARRRRRCRSRCPRTNFLFAIGTAINARMITSAQRSHSAITAGAHREMRPYGINHREHARPL